MRVRAQFCYLAMIAYFFAGGVERAGGASINIVVPNAQTDVMGNSVHQFPYATSGSSRFQQVYDASQFSAIRDGGGIISSVAFRSDMPCRTTFNIARNIQFNLSTASHGPDTLSRVFAENTGLDETIVFGPGPLPIDAFCYGGWPTNRFSVEVQLHTSFFYNPNLGNLLLDMRVFSSITNPPVPFLDGQNVTNDSTSSLIAYSVATSLATYTPTFGFVTQFKIWFEPRPRLEATLTETNLVLRWVNYPGQWTLQQNSVLGTSGTWQPAGGIVSTNGTNKVVTLPLDAQASSRFFRVVQSSAAAGAAGSPTNPEPVVVPQRDP